MQRFVFGFCALTASIPVIAQQIPAQPDMEHVVVTGTRTPKLLASSPVQVDVIDQVQIERLSIGTLRQVLEVMPGVVVRRSRKDGYNVQLNGFDGDHVLILMDGQPLVTPTGSSVDLDQISVSNIRQIEIVRGAASVLYGSSAMGGVINIITASQGKDYLKLDYEGSSFTRNALDEEPYSHQVRLQGGTRIGDWQLDANGQLLDNPGFDYDPATVSQNGGATDKQFINIGIQRAWQTLSLTAKSQWFEEDKAKNLSAIPGQSGYLQYLSDVEQWQQDVRLEQRNDWRISARYLSHDETSGNSNGLRHTDIRLAELDSQKVWMGKDVEWVAGAVVHQDSLNQHRLDSGEAEVDDASRESLEAYAQGNWQRGKQQYLAGVRVQNDSDFGWHHALRASLSSEFNWAGLAWTWRAGAGQSYRVPNLKERYYVFDHSNLGYMILGNPSLVPETALSGNSGLGFRWASKDDKTRLNAELSVHYAKADDFITTVPDADASAEAQLDISVYENIEQATLSGADLTLNLAMNSWQYQLNYSYLHATDQDNNRLSERPRHQLKASATWHIDTIDSDVQLYGVYEGDVAAAAGFQGIYQAHSTTLNAVFSQSVSTSFSWRAGVENLLDEHRNPAATQAGLYDARPISSRRVYVGVSYQFL